jgi:hypothetical protein
MASTRFSYDECRTKKQLQQSTDPGRWILNVPGNGSNPAYIEDPHIRIQKWGGNMMTNTVNLESDLLGVNRRIGRDCLGEDNYQKYLVSSSTISYPKCSTLSTEQSRAIAPAWTFREKEHDNWQYPLFNPQENTCLPFTNNLSTRVLEKDYYTPKRDCMINESNNLLSVSYNLIHDTSNV